MLDWLADNYELSRSAFPDLRHELARRRKERLNGSSAKSQRVPEASVVESHDRPQEEKEQPPQSLPSVRNSPLLKFSGKPAAAPVTVTAAAAELESASSIGPVEEQKKAEKRSLAEYDEVNLGSLSANRKLTTPASTSHKESAVMPPVKEEAYVALDSDASSQQNGTEEESKFDVAELPQEEDEADIVSDEDEDARGKASPSISSMSMLSKGRLTLRGKLSSRSPI